METKEFKISSISELAGTIDSIRINFDKEEDQRDEITVRFDDNIEKNEFLECLKTLFEYSSREYRKRRR